MAEMITELTELRARVAELEAKLAALQGWPVLMPTVTVAQAPAAAEVVPPAPVAP